MIKAFDSMFVEIVVGTHAEAISANPAIEYLDALFDPRASLRLKVRFNEEQLFCKFILYYFINKHKFVTIK